MKHLPFFALFVVLLFLFSCNKTDFVSVDLPRKETANYISLQYAKFGPQTGLPFAMENVLAAFNSIKTKSSAPFSEDDITPTHLYVRFTPTTLEELDSVKGLKDITIYQFPLDCEVSDGIIGPNNPFVKNGFPQYWCIVPIDYDLDIIDCSYEIESELWQPSFLDDTETIATTPFEMNLYSEICHEQGLEMASPIATKTTKYYPGGYVKYNDTQLGTIGIEGMEVDAFNTWHNYKAYSTNTGYLNYGSHYFTSSFKYRVKFERDDFAVKLDSTHTDLEYITSSTTGSYNQVFINTLAKFSVIFQAAYRYYYQDLDIPRPPFNETWSACLRICVHPDVSNHQGSSGLFTLDIRWPLANRPIVKVWGWGDSGEYDSDELYAITIHELTHAMHYNLDSDLYPQIEHRVKESLAYAIQHYLTHQRYPNHSNPFPATINYYTHIMRDLVDGTKTVQCNVAYDGSTLTVYSQPLTYVDTISYLYTYAELVEALKTCVTPLAWKNRIYSLYPGRATQTQLDNAFNFWFN